MHKVRKGEIETLKFALRDCSHLMYGFVGLTRRSYDITSLNVDLDMEHFREITNMKKRHPYLKVLLSLGGDYDNDQVDPQKYVHFLEGGRPLYDSFIQSSIAMVKNNGFDGLDLAFQFPRNKPRKVHGILGTYWKKFKKLFTGDFVVDPKAAVHKEQFTELAQSLSREYSNANLSLGLTVLPNVNSSWYFDIPKIHKHFDYINLFAFDFLTPERNPDEADYTAPIYFKDGQNRLPHYNVDFQVNYWLENGCPANKLNLGVATYGRAWKIERDSGLSGMPVVASTRRPADAGTMSRQAGLLSWPEICKQWKETSDDPLQNVEDDERKYGNYAFRPADENNEYGIWISYDGPDFAEYKADYARQKALGGMAVYDLSYDDFRGFCVGYFPILRSVLSIYQ
ncbi:chitinase-like protein Idgf1 isoform X1 [Musca autumnalis]|uniref:chitinase-like protein Idgf1 isoform X1 n=1 Tax=Musca autumnalis TaxID=221902 RepID=UPI003CE67E12